MAVPSPSPSGFSYAQAAKGRVQLPTSQAAISKPTPSQSTPAAGAFAELGSTTNWADDMEASKASRVTESRNAATEQNKTAQGKESPLDRTKADVRTQNTFSGISSPDLAASSSANDDSSSAANGGNASDTTWETKSQSSDPVWVAERKERQNAAQQDDSNARPGKKAPQEPKEAALVQPPPKPIEFTEAPPPVVNIWAKRMEEAKSKTTVSQPLAKPVQASAASAPAALGKSENHQPRPDTRKKPSPTAGPPRETDSPPKPTEVKKTEAPQERVNPTRNVQRPGPTANPVSSRAEPVATTTTKPAQREQQSLPAKLVPPPVKDEVSWPTPERAQSMERKESSTERDSADNNKTETPAESKARPKTSWQPLAVTPNILWETPEMNRSRGPGGERGGRGGNSSRGRGGPRGAFAGSKGGDRTNGTARDADTTGTTASRGRAGTADRDAMPPPPVQARASSSSESREGPNGRAGSKVSSFRPPPNGSISAGQSTAAPSADGLAIKGPNHGASTATNGEDDVKIPEPIPRSTSEASPTENGIESTGIPVRDFIPRGTQGDSRKDARPSEPFAKEWHGATRGVKRNARGRGGSREFANGHAATQGFGNGHADFVGGPLPPSPFAPGRGAQHMMPQHGRGGWARGTPRANSAPLDTYPARFPPFAAPTGLQIPAYVPGMYEYPGGMPMSAVPFAPAPVSEVDQLFRMVSVQLEYYFSVDNLIKDTYLRQNMDSQGFVFLDIVANFNRLKQLTSDKEIIRSICMASDKIEMVTGDDGQDRLRQREGWEKFVLPMDQRAAPAQTEGPKTVHRPELSPTQQWVNTMSYRTLPPGAVMGPLPQRRSFDPGFAPFGGFVPQFAPYSPLAEATYFESFNGEENRGRAAKSPVQEQEQYFPSMESGEDSDNEPELFPYETAGELMVVVRMPNKSRPRHHTEASRTFSNGSIDSRSIFGEIDKVTEDSASPKLNGGKVVTANGDSTPNGVHAGATPASKANQESEKEVLWMKDTELPQKRLPEDVSLEPYFTHRERALKQRDVCSTGTCPYDLDVLYQFWSHFLIRNFNKRMYKEFKYYAHDDAGSRHNDAGLKSLVQLYTKALLSSSTIRDSLLKDCIDLVKNEPAILRGHAFKQVRATWRDGSMNLKNRKKMGELLDDALKAQLES